MRQAAANRVSMRRPERKLRKISKYLYMNKGKVERGTIFKGERTFTWTTASSPKKKQYHKQQVKQISW
jgi:hypothetical protein